MKTDVVKSSFQKPHCGWFGGDHRDLISAFRIGLRKMLLTDEEQRSVRSALSAWLLLCYQEDCIGFIFEDCESPIETHMLSALICAASTRSEIYGVEIVTRNHSIRSGSFVSLRICTQHDIAGYRGDFYIQRIDPEFGKRSVIVECDGHDYHERTKEQASNDRKKDRAIQSSGLHVLRFTGSDIFRSPANCAQEVLEFLDSQHTQKG